jgi:phage terminase large subunit
MILNLNCTPVFSRVMRALSDPKYHVFVLEGGSRSSKTYSLIQLFIVNALRSKERTRVVCSRKKGTWLLATVWFDFTNILVDMGLLGNPDVKINNSKFTIRIKKWLFEFVGLDDVQRLHGLTCDIFWINEAMETTKDDFDQLEQRCSRYSILDYNPTAEEHWIYDNVCSREDCYFDHSTMLDNPFIPTNMKRKILSYEPTEYNYAQGTVDIRKWKIYGKGERAKIEGLIFSNVKIIKEIPIWVKSKWRAIDWGFSLDPTAIETVGFYKNSIYVDEECYSTGMLNPDIIKKLKQLPRLKIWADNAEPKTIKEISNAGFYIQGAKKGAGSILDGIQFMQGYTIYITERSFNIKKEFDNYTWQQDRNGKWIQMPVDDYNHAIDGIRYVCSMELMGKVDKERKQLGRTASAFAH